jgi:hypothetical protein
MCKLVSINNIKFIFDESLYRKALFMLEHTKKSSLSIVYLRGYQTFEFKYSYFPSYAIWKLVLMKLYIFWLHFCFVFPRLANFCFHLALFLCFIFSLFWFIIFFISSSLWGLGRSDLVPTCHTSIFLLFLRILVIFMMQKWVRLYSVKKKVSKIIWNFKLNS